LPGLDRRGARARTARHTSSAAGRRTAVGAHRLCHNRVVHSPPHAALACMRRPGTGRSRLRISSASR
jgi:hypothetical protein